MHQHSLLGSSLQMACYGEISTICICSYSIYYSFREEMVTDTVLRRHFLVTAENRFTPTQLHFKKDEQFEARLDVSCKESWQEGFNMCKFCDASCCKINIEQLRPLLLLLSACHLVTASEEQKNDGGTSPRTTEQNDKKCRKHSKSLPSNRNTLYF